MGRPTARALRRTGKIPGVLYGNGREAFAFAVESRHLRETLAAAGGRHAILEVKVPGASTPIHAFIKDMQLHPLRDTLQHFDLLEVRMDRAIQATVSIVFTGEAEGVKTYGGILAQNAHELTLEALPGDLPEHVEIDITRAQHRRLDQDRRPRRRSPASTYVGDPDTMLASVAQPKGPTAEEEAAEAEAPRPPRLPRRAPRRASPSPRARAASRPRTRSSLASSGSASGARPWTCSSPGSAIRAGATRGTRHNLGYLVAAELAARWRAPAEREKHGGALSEVRLEDGTTVALLRPLGFMNLSGGPVQKAVRAYGLGPEQVVCVHDDVEAAFGQVRAKLGGGLGGHNGLRSVAERLGTRDFARVRCGIGRQRAGDRRDLADWVLVAVRARRGSGADGRRRPPTASS